jgi:hypothetical protein
VKDSFVSWLDQEDHITSEQELICSFYQLYISYQECIVALINDWKRLMAVRHLSSLTLLQIATSSATAKKIPQVQRLKSVPSASPSGISYVLWQERKRIDSIRNRV